MSTTIKASGLRSGDSLLAAGKTDHRNKRLKVSRVERNGLGYVSVYGTRKGNDKDALLFRGLAPNLTVTINRA